VPEHAPDKPYVQKLTAHEQAVKDRMERRAAEAAEQRQQLLEKAERLGIELDADADADDDDDDDDDVIYTGPRGGRYRINSNDCKPYDVP